MRLLRLMIVCAFALATSACSSKVDDAESATAGSTGDRFYDAAVKKVEIGPPAVTAEQAKAIVDEMTADGTIGIGEINGMILTDPEKNAGRLNEALRAARESTSGN